MSCSVKISGRVLWHICFNQHRTIWHQTFQTVVLKQIVYEYFGNSPLLVNDPNKVVFSDLWKCPIRNFSDWFNFWPNATKCQKANAITFTIELSQIYPNFIGMIFTKFYKSNAYNGGKISSRGNRFVQIHHRNWAYPDNWFLRKLSQLF